MCISSEGHALLPADRGVGAPQILSFTDLITNDEISNIRRSAKSYNVDYTTPLGSPTTITGVFEIDQDARLQRHVPRQLPGCQNRNCHSKRYPPKEGGWKLREWQIWIEETGIRSKYWGFGNEPLCFGQDVFARIYNASFYSGIIACRNPQCEKRKEAFAAVAPRCAWVAFRDFILTCLACMVSKAEWDFILHLIFPDDEIEVPKSFCIDIRGILDVYMWSSRIARREVDEEFAGIEAARQSYKSSAKIWQVILSDYESDAITMSQSCHDQGLCPNRLWNASFQGPDSAVGVFHLGEAAKTLLPLGPMDAHVDCTAQYCLRAHDNSTLVKQAHKCADGRCEREIFFRTDLLNQAMRGMSKGVWFNTAWRLRRGRPGRLLSSMPLYTSKPQVMRWGERNYMAISHVWSDGTGVGLKTPGKVNQCLYRYFANIADQLGCDGLWWDAISIPSERTARATAIERMLENFENASVTLIHDQDLVKLPWRDDGSPAIALVLSSWFTRGWTAAELFASRGHPVKVLYADPANPDGAPLIKNLDGDVFAADVGELMNPRHLKHFPGHCLRDILNPASSIPRQGYFVAAETLKVLRHPFLKETTEIWHLSDLLKALSRRTTSWVKDHMLIAGLMCQEKTTSKGPVSSSMTGPEIMKTLLTTFQEINVTDLLHGEVPITTHGPWSWCPQSIFYFGQLYHSPDLSDMSCQILSHGRLSGRFRAYEVLEDDVIIPCGSHPAIRARVSAVLSSRRKCLLLSTPHIRENQLYVLFQSVYINHARISGRWVACVQLQLPLDLQTDPTLQDLDRGVGRREELFMVGLTFEFGNDTTNTGTPLQPLSYGFLSWTTRLFEWNDQFREGTMWVLSVGKDGRPGVSETQDWGPQPIYLYDYDARMDQKFQRSKYNVPPIHPSTLIAWDLSNKENMIRASFLEVLSKTIVVNMMAYDMISLTWSFPYYYDVYPRCDYPQRTVFESTFCVVSEILRDGQGYDMSLGRNTFEQSIEPQVKQWRRKPPGHEWYRDWNTIIWSCKSCRQCPSCNPTQKPSQQIDV
ncbi:hypothetical protein F5B20DRAFT_554264 [Whalleya microplaca]|nr:hypothetical protein F5B20DRAFT_554264 [Whalleya microplaca]